MTVAVYVTPHQDDETLSKGASVRKHLEQGYEVHTVLLTTGQNSAVQPGSGLTVTQFIAARDDEMARATRQLGVLSQNCHISSHRVPDGGLTVADAEYMILDFLSTHPGALVKTYSNRPTTGRHVDHIATGQAALNLFNQGVITDLRLYVEPWLLPAFKSANPGIAIGTDVAANTAAVQAAFGEYKAVDTIGGKYGIGYQSVKAEFDAAWAAPKSYWHVPIGV
jgi:LmbE family N-acetylglucosaminyl deacetylase